MLGTDAWQRYVHLPVFITGGCLGPRLPSMPEVVEVCRYLPFLVNLEGMVLEQDPRRAQHHQLQLTLLKHVLALHSTLWSRPLPF